MCMKNVNFSALPVKYSSNLSVQMILDKRLVSWIKLRSLLQQCWLHVDILPLDLLKTDSVIFELQESLENLDNQDQNCDINNR